MTSNSLVGAATVDPRCAAMTHQYATWDAAYVLGALSDADRREFEGHLTTCPTCHRAVGELAGMPGLLAQLTRDDVESIDQFGSLDDGSPGLPPEVLGSLLDVVRSRRRRARMLAWGGGCAAAAAVAVGLFVAIRPVPTVSPPASRPGAASTLSMAPVRPSCTHGHRQSGQSQLGHRHRAELQLRRGACERPPRRR